MTPSSPGIRTVRTVCELRGLLGAARRDRDRSPRSVGLVPTMGALHQGHVSLIARARELCELVVVSLFVNPSQFDEQQDLERYPRQESRDLEVAAGAGADLVFAPAVQEVYPDGFLTSVEVLGISERLEGQARGQAHFRGVTTVVCKLLNMVQPDAAFFGQKDAQQALVIKRLVRDLDMPVDIEVCATVREPDGLACSSRNAMLDEGERARARALYAGLSAAVGLTCDGERCPQVLLRSAHEAMRLFGVEPEYLALVDPATLEPLRTLDRDGLLAVAARVGSTRLIDNVVLHPSAVTGRLDELRCWRGRSGQGRRVPAWADPYRSQRKAETACSV